MSYFAMQGDSLLLTKHLDCETVSSIDLIMTASNHSAVWDMKVIYNNILAVSTC